MILKKEVLEMKIEGVFPSDYVKPFFDRFPDLNGYKGYKTLTDVMNSRSADEKFIGALRTWYNELKSTNKEEAA